MRLALLAASATLLCGAPPHRVGMRTPRPPPPSASLSRRCLLALTPLLLPSRPASALFGLGQALPNVKEISRPGTCQGRCLDQDFVAVRYTARRTGGAPFDTRYAERPLIYELGSFYLPGVDKSLEGTCVGSKLKMSWASSPDLGAQYASVLPPGTPIELELELVTIKYSLFGEKMRNASSTCALMPTPAAARLPR